MYGMIGIDFQTPYIIGLYSTVPEVPNDGKLITRSIRGQILKGVVDKDLSVMMCVFLDIWWRTAIHFRLQMTW